MSGTWPTYVAVPDRNWTLFRLSQKQFYSANHGLGTS